MTYDEMATQLDGLSGLKFRPADYQTHWTGLQDLPADVLAGAVRRAARQCQDFPTPAELRALADAGGTVGPAVEDRSEPMDTPVVVASPFLKEPITVSRVWKYYCEDCQDSGVESLWCGDEALRKPWQPRSDCARPTAHGPHEWVVPCACVHRNPALVNKRAAQAKYATQRGGERRSA